MIGLEAVLLSVLSRVADGSLEEAGGRLWLRLTELVGRLHGRRDVPLVPDRVPAAGSAELALLAEDLGRAAERDEALADALSAWLAEGRDLLVQRSVANVVHGNVGGSVIQAGDIGTLNL